MVIVRNERYMFVQHVPIMYLTYTYHLSFMTELWGTCWVYIRYMLGICLDNMYRLLSPITIGVKPLLRYMMAII